MPPLEELLTTMSWEEAVAFEHDNIHGFKTTRKKEKSFADIVEDLSKNNQKLFDNVKTLREKLNAIKKEEVFRLCTTYDEKLFDFINKPYCLKTSIDEIKNRKMIAYIEGSIVQHITRLCGDSNTPQDSFVSNFLYRISSRILLDNKTSNEYITMGNDLYRFIQLISSHNNELNKLTCREKVKESVCEDYLSNNVRIKPTRMDSITIPISFRPSASLESIQQRYGIDLSMGSQF